MKRWKLPSARTTGLVVLLSEQARLKLDPLPCAYAPATRAVAPWRRERFPETVSSSKWRERVKLVGWPRLSKIAGTSLRSCRKSSKSRRTRLPILRSLLLATASWQPIRPRSNQATWLESFRPRPRLVYCEKGLDLLKRWSELMCQILKRVTFI